MDLMNAVLFAQSLDAVGVPLPAKARLALDIHAAALTAATNSPTDDLVAALNDGTLTTDNVGEKVLAAALAATAREKAHEVVRDMTMPLRRVFAEAVRQDADRILRDLRKVFAHAAKVMQRAGGLFSVDATGEEVLRAGNEAAAAWRDLDDARRTLEAVYAVRVGLATGYLGEDLDDRVLMFTKGIDSALGHQRAHDAWTLGDRGTGGRWHALAAEGFALALAGPADVAATKAAIAATEQSKADAEREAGAAQLREDNRGWLTAPQPAA